MAKSHFIIEVFLPPNEHASGTLECYSSSYNIAIISAKNLRAIRPANILDQVQSESKKVVAIGRLFDGGVLMASSGEVTANHSRFDCQDLVLSTCKIKKAGIKGPLIDVDGSFVGMNFYDKKATPFLPMSKILELLRVSVWTGSLEVIDYVRKPNRWPVPKPYWYHFLLDEKYLVRNRRRPRKILH